jgi:hypothetical protein
MIDIAIAICEQRSDDINKAQKFPQRSEDIEREFRCEKENKTNEHGDRSLRDVTAINSAFKLPLLAAVNKGKLIQIKIQFALSPIPLWSEDTRYPLEDVEAR